MNVLLAAFVLDLRYYLTAVTQHAFGGVPVSLALNIMDTLFNFFEGFVSLAFQ